MPNGPDGPTHGPHSCDLCEAVNTLLDGFLVATANGLRESLVSQSKAEGARTTDLWTRRKGFDVVDVKEIAKRVDEQHVHELAAVLTWWVRQSLVTFNREIAPLENAIVNAFRENGITLYEPHVEPPKESP